MTIPDNVKLMNNCNEANIDANDKDKQDKKDNLKSD